MSGTLPSESSRIKTALRESSKLALCSLSDTQIRDGSRTICDHFAAWEVWKSARTVMMFVPVTEEPNLKPLAEQHLRRGGRLCFPRVDWVAKQMVAAAVTDLDRSLILRRNRIREPLPECPAVPPQEIDLILIPGLAFDRTGRRLGRGGGFYDRFLADPALRAVRCGVLFECQLLPEIPAEPHDIHVDYLCTPGQLWKA